MTLVVTKQNQNRLNMETKATKVELSLPDNMAEAEVIESIDCLVPLLQQLAMQLPKRTSQPDRLVQKLAEQEATIEKMKTEHQAIVDRMKVDQAALEKQVAELQSELVEQKGKQLALKEALDTNEREQTRQLSLVMDHFMNDGRASKTTVRDTLWCIAHQRPQRIEYPAGTWEVEFDWNELIDW